MDDQLFVNICSKDGSDDIMELPREGDGTVLLSTVQAQFPSAIGLKYKSSSGGWRGIRAENNVLTAPNGGWGEGIYIITESDSLKRKAAEPTHSSDSGDRKSRKTQKMLEDLIVLGIPLSTTEQELDTFFSNHCGELSFCELKMNRDTNKSRGFGFLRFKTVEGAEEALKGYHEIDGRKLEVRLSRKKEEVPMKLFVGRLATGTTKDEINDYFSEFGDMSDVFVPANRGFAFITYSDREDAMRVLRMNHVLGGNRLHVTPAQPKEDKGPLRQENFGVASNYTNNGSRSSFSQSPGGGYTAHPAYTAQPSAQPSAPAYYQQQSPLPGSNNVASELKDMLMQLINQK